MLLEYSGCPVPSHEYAPCMIMAPAQPLGPHSLFGPNFTRMPQCIWLRASMICLCGRLLCSACCFLAVGLPVGHPALELQDITLSTHTTDRQHLDGGGVQGATPPVMVCPTSAPNLQPWGGGCKPFQHQSVNLGSLLRLAIPAASAAKISSWERILVANSRAKNVWQGKISLHVSQAGTVATASFGAAVHSIFTKTAGL
jgi:hypothetical protein